MPGTQFQSQFQLHGKHVLVLGLGESGLAMARWLARQGAVLRVADSRAQPPNVATLAQAVPHAAVAAGPFATQLLDGIELIALSPGVPVQEPLVQQAIARGVPVVSEIELFAVGLRQITPGALIVAITGSNGKTTTTALTAHLLNAAGIAAVACGNISPSALDALMDAIDGVKAGHAMPRVWVLELSSFQLETTSSLAADAAALLNVSEDHLDRYADLDEYTAAKARVFADCGVCVVNRDDARTCAAVPAGAACISFGLGTPPDEDDFGVVDGWIVRGDQRLIALPALKLVGLQNAANAMAALALCDAVGAPLAELLPALAEFTGLAHRVELVAMVHGVAYYDDSKGTNVGATLAAVQGLGRPVAIILGGEGKAQDFSPLKPALARHARAVALIGRDAELIAAAIDGCGVTTRRCADLDEAVRWCAEQTLPGDAVLLSPACASFDMFRNYGHRAQVFIAAVHAIESELRANGSRESEARA
ncbi:MAG: UDP-N-acetylmuramoyl-L-alanine--D-glutamate ligase [Propionivibrio sp.]